MRIFFNQQVGLLSGLQGIRLELENSAYDSEEALATIMELNLTLPFDVHGQLWHLLPTGRFTVSVTTRDSQRPTIKVRTFFFHLYNLPIFLNWSTDGLAIRGTYNSRTQRQNFSLKYYIISRNTSVVNFINILWAPVRKCFSHESAFCSFSLITVWLYNFLMKEYWRKSGS